MIIKIIYGFSFLVFLFDLIQAKTDLSCDTLNNSCLNGGQCRQADGQGLLFCMCPIQYSGKNCEFKISQCPNICVNGMCVEDNGTFHCQCATGWSGLSCNQSTVPGCQSVDCNHGLCIPKVIGFTCLCYSGWEGPFCKNKIKTDLKCSPDCPINEFCQSGICLKSTFEKKICPKFFKGDNCDEIDESITPKCSTNICHNGGSCYRVGNKILCACKGNFKGPYCKNIK